MIVDDDQLQCDTLATVLEQENCQVRTTQQGLELFSLIRLARPDLILLDVVMGEIDGLSLLRRLKAMPAQADIPVIMISGKHERGLVTACLQAGACDFIVKPLQRSLLVQRVGKAMGHLGLSG